jgi:hypothetical protein
LFLPRPVAARSAYNLRNKHKMSIVFVKNLQCA